MIAFGQGTHALPDTSGHKIDDQGQGGTWSDFTGRFGGLTVKSSALARRHMATLRRSVWRGR